MFVTKFLPVDFEVTLYNSTVRAIEFTTGHMVYNPAL
jgi:hypothetical protein